MSFHIWILPLWRLWSFLPMQLVRYVSCCRIAGVGLPTCVCVYMRTGMGWGGILQSGSCLQFHSVCEQLWVTCSGPLCDLTRAVGLMDNAGRWWGRGVTNFKSLQQIFTAKKKQPTTLLILDRLYTKRRMKNANIPRLVNSCADCVYNRDAVVAVDRLSGKETDEFQPQKRTKIYGIATAYAQCPSGIKQSKRVLWGSYIISPLQICVLFKGFTFLATKYTQYVASSTDVQPH